MQHCKGNTVVSASLRDSTIEVNKDIIQGPARSMDLPFACYSGRHITVSTGWTVWQLVYSPDLARGLLAAKLHRGTSMEMNSSMCASTV